MPAVGDMHTVRFADVRQPLVFAAHRDACPLSVLDIALTLGGKRQMCGKASSSRIKVTTMAQPLAPDRSRLRPWTVDGEFMIGAAWKTERLDHKTVGGEGNGRAVDLR